MTKYTDDGDSKSTFGFDRFEEIQVEGMAEGEEVLLYVL